MYRRITKNILYETTGLRLEELYIEIGSCRCVIFREFKWDETSVQLKEYNKLPDWYRRQLMIDETLSERQNYYLKNKMKMDSYSKEWKIKNKEKWNEYQREYKRKRYQSKKLG